MREYNLEGFVLRRFSLGEADRILNVFSREKGKIKLVAKGVRRGKAKLAGHLEPFCEVRLRVIKGKSLDIIIGAEATKLYDITSLEQDALSSAYLMCEILDRMLPEEQPNEPAFELLQSSLSSLTNAVPAVLAVKVTVEPEAEATTGAAVTALMAVSSFTANVVGVSDATAVTL